jgi:superfamily II DNA or RNA helicase
MQEMRQSWAMAPVRPYDVYMKALYSLVRDRIEGDDGKDILWDDAIANRLATFQRVAVKQAIQMIRTNGGVFVSDVVGLGKSYIGAAIVKHFERTDHARPLILCPKPLVGMWERYNEVYQLNARVLSTGYLVENGGANILLDDVKYRDRDFLLIDESHNFRNPDAQRYKVVQAFLASGRPVCFLTATPRNKSAWDVYHQIKLFHQQDKTDLPIDPPNLREYFKLIEKDERTLRELLSNVLIRRTRNHILRWYGFDVPAGEDAQAVLYEPSAAEEQDMVDALRQVSDRYVLADFDAVKLQRDIEHDLKLLRKVLALVEPITPEQDAKLQKLKRVLREKPLAEGKRLIFTQYADTARYLYENLNPGGRIGTDHPRCHGRPRRRTEPPGLQ